MKHGNKIAALFLIGCLSLLVLPIVKAGSDPGFSVQQKLDTPVTPYAAEVTFDAPARSFTLLPDPPECSLLCAAAERLNILTGSTSRCTERESFSPIVSGQRDYARRGGGVKRAADSTGKHPPC